MKVTLIYNPNSGLADRVTADELAQSLIEAGFTPVYEATSSESDLDPILDQAQDLVVVAGGDGSVRAVASRLIDRQVGIAIIPLGTANNIARALNIEGSTQELIDGLRRPSKYGFDIGCVRSPWGTDYFLEAFGYGLFANGLARYDPHAGKNVLRSLVAALQTLAKFQPDYNQVHLDGQDISARYLLFKMLNTPSFGPRVQLAPEADPSDGLLDVVAILAEDGTGFLQYLKGLLRDELDELSAIKKWRGKVLQIAWEGPFQFHVDAEIRPERTPATSDTMPGSARHLPERNTPENTLSVEIMPQAVEIWLPKLLEMDEK